jgi:hypothetical protein
MNQLCAVLVVIGAAACTVSLPGEKVGSYALPGEGVGSYATPKGAVCFPGDDKPKNYSEVEKMPLFDGNSARFALTGDGTVSDSLCKLTWQFEDTSSTGAAGNDQGPDGTNMNWLDAVKHCNDLDLAGPGWRLPTVAELLSLGDTTATVSPSIAPLFKKSASWLWSGTLKSDEPGAAFWVGYHNGVRAQANDALVPVRCVR